MSSSNWVGNIYSFKNQRIYIKNEILAQSFSYEFSEIFKNNFFYRTPVVAASAYVFLGTILKLYLFNKF